MLSLLSGEFHIDFLRMDITLPSSLRLFIVLHSLSLTCLFSSPFRPLVVSSVKFAESEAVRSRAATPADHPRAGRKSRRILAWAPLSLFTPRSNT